MRDYLVFQLYGPFVSWGEIAVGEERPSALIPTKSAILGILAAAQGIKRPGTVRDDEDRKACENKHKQMSQNYGIAVKADAVGSPLFDYHTTEVPRGDGFVTRHDEILEVRRQKHGKIRFKGTILSRREYRQEAYYIVAIWARPEAPFPLEELRKKLIEPEYMLYLGRKACPPALPLNPRVVSSSNIEGALDQIALPEEIKSSFDRILQDRSIIAWDTDAETQIKPMQTVERRDGVFSRLRWQFSVRSEHQAIMEVIHAK